MVRDASGARFRVAGLSSYVGLHPLTAGEDYVEHDGSVVVAVGFVVAVGGDDYDDWR